MENTEVRSNCDKWNGWARIYASEVINKFAEKTVPECAIKHFEACKKCKREIRAFTNVLISEIEKIAEIRDRIYE
jgi:hypothetical protein